MGKIHETIYREDVEIGGKVEAVELHATRCDDCGDPIFLVSVDDPFDGGRRVVAGHVSYEVLGVGRRVVRCRYCAAQSRRAKLGVEPATRGA